MTYRATTLVAAATIALAGCASSGGEMDNEMMAGDDGGAMSSAEMASASSMPAMGHVYEVILENLTEGQPFSPGVLVTHSPDVWLWAEGMSSNAGLKAIAEDGNPAPAVEWLKGMEGVGEVVRIDQPTHRMGGPAAHQQTFRVRAPEGATRLSLAVMLICTNDGFTGVSGLELPGMRETVRAMAYDAGTEANQETYASLVDPCGAAGPVMMSADGMNVHADTDEVIAPHMGVKGTGDLTREAHGWNGPVARITVSRVDS